MSKKKELVKAFQSVIPLDIKIDIEGGVQKHFKLQVKALGGETLSKYSSDLKKSLSSDKKTKAEEKEIKKARKLSLRMGERLNDVEHTIQLLQENNKEGKNNELLLAALAKKDLLSEKTWDADDTLENLTEGMEEPSLGEIIIKSDKETKKLFDLIVIGDDGLGAFMKNESIGYTVMTKHIQEKMSEAQGND